MEPANILERQNRVLVTWMQNTVMVPSSSFSQLFSWNPGWAPDSGDVASGKGIRSPGWVPSSGQESVLQPLFVPNPKPSHMSQTAEGCLIPEAQLWYLQDVVKKVLLLWFSYSSAHTSEGPGGTLAGCKAFHRTKSKRKKIFQRQDISSCVMITRNVIVASGLLTPTKYQTTAPRKGSTKGSHCRGHKSLLYCGVLGRSNTELLLLPPVMMKELRTGKICCCLVK